MLLSIPKKRVYIVDIIIALVCIAGFRQVYDKGGLEWVLQYSDQGVQVLSTTGMKPGSSIQEGDYIRSVNGHAVLTPEDLEFLFDAEKPGNFVTITVDRKGIFYTLPVELTRINSLSYLTILFLTGAIFFTIGLVVLYKRPEGESVALIFHWISMTVSIHIMTTFGSYETDPAFTGYVLRMIFFLASVFTPVLFLHFSLLFPCEKWTRYLKTIRGMYAISIVFFVALSFLFIQAARILSISRFHDFMLVYNVGRWFFALCLILGVANMFHSYRTAREEGERRKLRWVILGLVIGPLSFGLLWQIPQTVTSQALVPEEVLLILTALTPLTFAISIVRYHLFDIDVIFNRGTVYFFVLALVMAVYSVIVGFTALLLGTLTIRASIIASGIAAVMVALLFEPARKGIQRFVDRRFFRVRYDYRLAQQEFMTSMSGFMDSGLMARYIVRKINDILQPEAVALVTYNPEQNSWNQVSEINMSGVTRDVLDRLSAYTSRSMHSVLAVNRCLEPGIGFYDLEGEMTGEKTIVIALPVRLQKEELSGFLLMGEKKSGTRYSMEDVDLLKSVLNQYAAAIERIRLQRDLLLKHEEMRRLDELNRIKSFFVSSVSHDLQTPLTSIKMFAEMLRSGKPLSVEEQNEYLAIIQGETERLSRLINNVLDFSRIERGIKSYNFSRMDLIQVVNEVLRVMRYTIEQNGFQVQAALPAEKIILKIDRDAIAEALMNLISNAIKYSETVKHMRIAVHKEDDYVVLSVQDRGIGIDESEKEKIFTTFYRSEDPKVKTRGGAGLGLTLVQHIAEAHKGKISVESKTGQGSTFSLYLPEGDQ